MQVLILKGIKIIGLAFLFQSITSCKKWVEVDPPSDQIVSSDVFSTSSKAEAAVSAVYAKIINAGSQHIINPALSLYGGYLSDELAHFSPNSVSAPFLTNELQPTNGAVQMMWRTAYETIYYSNVCIEGLQSATNLPQEQRDRLVAEMKLVRAWLYFYLFQLYGEVPMILNTDYRANSTAPRTDSVILFDQIVSDLKESEQVLPTEYPSNERIRPTKWAAFSILSRVLLHQKKWGEAEIYATKVIQDGPFGLIAEPKFIFLKNSMESIWQLRPQSPYLPITLECLAFGVPQVLVQESITSAMERHDRRWDWVDSIEVAGLTYYYPVKYRNITSSVTEYFTLLRIADLILIRAESRLRQEKWTDALGDINLIRSRAGLANLPASSDEEYLLTEILNQRLFEFFGEHADRWFSLKRTNKGVETLRAIKPSLSEHSLLLPIPFTEITRNPYITQNPGY
jgi:hypothetical protein